MCLFLSLKSTCSSPRCNIPATSHIEFSIAHYSMTADHILGEAPMNIISLVFSMAENHWYPWWRHLVCMYQVTVIGPRLSWVNMGSDNGLVPSGNKPLSEPILTQIYATIWRHQTTISYNCNRKILTVTMIINLIELRLRHGIHLRIHAVISTVKVRALMSNWWHPTVLHICNYVSIPLFYIYNYLSMSESRCWLSSFC